MSKSIFLPAALIAFTGLPMTQVYAGTVGSGSNVNCNPADVQVTWYQQITPAVGPQISVVNPISALTCIGAYDSNDKPQPKTNLGYADDGLFNGEKDKQSGLEFDPGAFIGTVNGVNTGLALQDLDNDGVVDDPGWITVGKYEDKEFTGNLVNGQDIIGDDDSTGVLQSFFSCTEGSSDTKKCDDDDTTFGKWSLTPDAGIPDRFATASRESDKSFFDAFAIVLKGGDYFTAFLFTAAQFGITDLMNVYNFGGTFTMPTVSVTEKVEQKQKVCTEYKNNKCKEWEWKDVLVEKTTTKQYDLSHITLLAHDPQAPDNVIPEPGILTLLGVGLLGFGWMRRARLAG
ncbi:PEP-CTERM sorting domain-containing protein [Allochromatium palmeri]|uniref:PEP-CTERM sorting domain-containing protein n=1 Tax=Allochromatium palmeri TaxID=231048 RepID=A0A6N8EFM6_9GAMM|nr:PEP-CTERM sorting domain-containing protein [Allochromatium palmeri]MTW23023.1 PEP-CTERM sorting domain-containing protein [Allochromatium palmeri]